MVGSSNGIAGQRRWFILLSMVATIATMIVGMLLWQAVELDSFARVSDQVDRVRWVMTGFRFALVGALAIFWPRLWFLCSSRGAGKSMTWAQWIALRWRVIGWLLFIEVVIGQNPFGSVINVVHSLS